MLRESNATTGSSGYDMTKSLEDLPQWSDGQQLGDLMELEQGFSMKKWVRAPGGARAQWRCSVAERLCNCFSANLSLYQHFIPRNSTIADETNALDHRKLDVYAQKLERLKAQGK